MENKNSNSVEFKNISKFFPGVIALNDVSFRAESGRVYAIMGENGAGKSTLLKIMNGDYTMTHGEMLLNDTPVKFQSPKEAIDAGISVIYQERQIVEHLSVAENVFLGSWKRRHGFIDYDEMNRKAQEVIDKLNLPFSPEIKVGELSIAHQQMVEIMKAYVRDAKFIAFDEPTASLTDTEIDTLFAIIERMKCEGKVIFYVSHRLAEIDMIADVIVVLKDGALVGVVEQCDTTHDELIRMMVGRDLGDIFGKLPRNDNIGDIALEVESLSGPTVYDVSFTVRKGEILGFSGLVGSGRTEVMRLIMGEDPILDGRIKVDGQEVKIRAPKDAIQNGIVMLPEDRKKQGLFSNQSVSVNLSVSILSKLLNKAGLLSPKKESQVVNDLIDQFDIRTPSADKIVGELSGGNQQKTIFARCHATDPEIIILDEPTKGIDVGAKAEFYHIIVEYARMGKAVILISSEMPELIGLADRIIVMREGRIAGVVQREEASEEALLKLAMLGIGGNTV
ncbi:MAG TPA: sugar ABC transporter ATP-binding protein [Clostridiaceae bacterium]|nr:sugar ABC transporter ATP-binding protein [Clostridiaceae bacterium]